MGPMAANNTTALASSQSVGDPTLYFWFFICFAFSVTASLTLILLIAAITTSRRLRNGAGSLLLHLFVVNLLISGIFEPIMLLERFMATKFTRIHVNCTAYFFLRLVALCVECWSEFFLAVNRFVAILLPHRYQRWTRKAVLVSIILVTWTMSVAVILPVVFGYGIVLGKVPPLFVCAAIPAPSGIQIPNMELGMYLPLCGVGLIYASIGISSRLRDKAVRSNLMRRRVRIARILFLAYLFNLALYIPMPIMSAYFHRVKSSQTATILWLVASQVVGYGANPALFLILSSEYRNAAWTFVRGKKMATRAIRGIVLISVGTIVTNEPQTSTRKEFRATKSIEH